MKNDGRIVVFDLDMNFAVTNLATAGTPAADPGATTALADVIRFELQNTNAADCIRVYAGMAGATAELIGKVGPSQNATIHAIVNKGQQLFFRSTVAAVSTGRLFITGYN